MAVGEMMHNLANGPVAGPVGCVELRVGQSSGGFAQFAGQFREFARRRTLEE